MAAHVETLLPLIVERLNQRVANKDFRVAPTPALDLGRRNIPAITQDAKTREDAVFAIDALNRQNMPLLSSRDANHKGARGASRRLFPIWSQHAVAFSISMKQLDNNTFTMNEAQSRQFADGLEALRRKLNDQTVMNVFTDRSQINIAAQQIGQFDAVDDVFDIPIAETQLFFQNVSSMMGMNNYNGQLFLLADPRAVNSADFLKAQGSSNATNLSWQFGNMDVTQESKLAMGVNTIRPNNGFLLAMPEHAYSVTTWVPPINLRSQTTMVSQYGVIVDPVTDITIAVHYYHERANTNGATYNGATQDVVVEFELSVDYCYIKAPFTNPLESAIYAAALA